MFPTCPRSTPGSSSRGTCLILILPISPSSLISSPYSIMEPSRFCPSNPISWALKVRLRTWINHQARSIIQNLSSLQEKWVCDPQGDVTLSILFTLSEQIWRWSEVRKTTITFLYFYLWNKLTTARALDLSWNTVTLSITLHHVFQYSQQSGFWYRKEAHYSSIHNYTLSAFGYKEQVGKLPTYLSLLLN